MEKVEKTTIKKIYSRFKENFSTTFLYSQFLFLILLFVFVLLILFLNLFTVTSLFSFLMFLIVISFLIGILTPSIYSYFICNDLFDNKEGINVDFKMFLANRKIGKNPAIKSQLRLFITILYSILIYLGIFILVISIIFAIEMNNQNLNSIYGYYLEVSKIINIQNTEEYIKELREIYSKYETYILNTTLICSLFASFPALYYFIHHTLISLLKYYIVTSLPGLPVNERCYKKALNDSNYYKGYYRLMWPYLILFIIIFYSTSLILYFVGHVLNAFLVISSSLLMSMFILMPFLPLVLNYNKFNGGLSIKRYFILYKGFYEEAINKDEQIKNFVEQNHETLIKSKEKLDDLASKKDEDDILNNDDKDKKDE